MSPTAVSVSLDTSVATPTVARALAHRFIARCGFDDQFRVTGLLVTELVTNAVVHGGSARSPRAARDPSTRWCVCGGEGPCIRLNMAGDIHAVRVEVFDHSPTLPALVERRPLDESGRGLHLVQSLADCWGSEALPDGKVTWFELTQRS
jgi:histidine kinase-like protein